MSKKITYKALKIKKLMVAMAAMALSSGSMIHTSAMETIPVPEKKQGTNVEGIQTEPIIKQENLNEQESNQEVIKQNEENSEKDGDQKSVQETISKILKKESTDPLKRGTVSANNSINESIENKDIDAPQNKTENIIKPSKEPSLHIIPAPLKEGNKYTFTEEKDLIRQQPNIREITVKQGKGNNTEKDNSEIDVQYVGPFTNEENKSVEENEPFEDVNLSFEEDYTNYVSFLEEHKDNYLSKLIFSDAVLNQIGQIDEIDGVSRYTDYSIPEYSSGKPLAIYNDDDKNKKETLLANYVHTYDDISKELKEISGNIEALNIGENTKYVNYIQQIVLIAQNALLRSSEIADYGKDLDQELSYEDLIDKITTTVKSKEQTKKAYHEKVMDNLVALNILMRLLLLAVQDENRITENKRNEITGIISFTGKDVRKTYEKLIEIMKKTYNSISNNMRVILPVLLTMWNIEKADVVPLTFMSTDKKEVKSNLPELLYNYSVGTTSRDEFVALRNELVRLIQAKTNVKQETKELIELAKKLKQLYNEGPVAEINKILGLAEESIIDYHIIRTNKYIEASKYTETYNRRNEEFQKAYTNEFPAEYKEYLKAIVEQRIKIIPEEAEQDTWFDNAKNMNLWIKFKELQKEHPSYNKTFINICEVIGSLSSLKNLKNNDDYYKIGDYLANNLDLNIEEEDIENYYATVCYTTIARIQENFDGTTPKIKAFHEQVNNIPAEAKKLEKMLVELASEGIVLAIGTKTIDNTAGYIPNVNEMATMQAGVINYSQKQMEIQAILRAYTNAATNLNRAFTKESLNEIMKELNSDKQKVTVFCGDINSIIEKIEDTITLLKAQKTDIESNKISKSDILKSMTEGIQKDLSKYNNPEI